MAASLTKQTITLTLANAYTRGLGFLLRLALARIMGAEALGMMELTSSVSMLALTPVTAGTPIAVSRMTARHPSCDQRQVLLAGLGMQRRALTGTILSSCVTLVLTAWWAAIPRLRLYGAALAMMAGQFVNLCWGLTLLLHRVREKEEKLQC